MLLKCRARKKKSLTDPVLIIPFPNQLDKQPVEKVVEKVVPQVERPLFSEKKEIKNLQKPSILSSGNLNTTNLSINALLNNSKQKENQDQLNSKLEDAFTQDALHMAWKAYAFNIRDNGQGTVFSAMSKREPQILDNFQVHQIVDNAVQHKFMTGIAIELQDYLRKELKNYSITLSFDIAEETDTQRTLSSQEKFAAMARKNPSLHTLKTKFDLDIDY